MAIAYMEKVREMNKCGIYEIVNTINGKRYTGSAVDIPDRWRCHRKDLQSVDCHHSRSLQRAWNKYGEDVFEFRVLLYCDPIKEILVDEFEQRAIDQKSEYNICKVAGSNLGMKFGPPSEEHIAKLREASTGKRHSKKTLAKMSKAQKGRKISKETRAKISTAKTGVKMSAEACANMSKANKGRKHTAEAKANMSVAQKGHKVSKETRAKLSAAHKGKRLSKEHRASISAAISGVKHPLYGKRHSPETRANMRKASAARWTSEARAEFGTKRRGLEQHQVHDIRHLLALGDMTQREIAEYFPVVEAVIGNINTGRTYADW